MIDKNEEDAVEKELTEGTKDIKLNQETPSPTEILLSAIYALVKPGQGVVFKHKGEKYVAQVNLEKNIIINKGENVIQDLESVPEGLVNYVNEEASIDSTVPQ